MFRGIELWRDIDDSDGYAVSCFGRVRRARNGLASFGANIQLIPVAWSAPVVMLEKDGVERAYPVDVLVRMAFVGAELSEKEKARRELRAKRTKFYTKQMRGDN